MSEDETAEIELELPDEVVEQLTSLAERYDMTIDELVSYTIRRYLAAREDASETTVQISDELVD